MRPLVPMSWKNGFRGREHRAVRLQSADDAKGIAIVVCPGITSGVVCFVFSASQSCGAFRSACIALGIQLVSGSPREGVAYTNPPPERMTANANRRPYRVAGERVTCSRRNAVMLFLRPSASSEGQMTYRYRSAGMTKRFGETAYRRNSTRSLRATLQLPSHMAGDRSVAHSADELDKTDTLISYVTSPSGQLFGLHAGQCETTCRAASVERPRCPNASLPNRSFLSWKSRLSASSLNGQSGIRMHLGCPSSSENLEASAFSY